MKVIPSKSFLIILLLLCFPALNSQQITQKEFAKAVQQADILFYYDEDYDLAATRYEALLKQFPSNSNLAVKLGICYLNIDGGEKMALKLLSLGAKNIVAKDDDYNEIGEKAPLDTYLYLAVAYHRNDSLEKAIRLYADAKKRLGNMELFRNDYIDNQIRDCKYAIELQKKPQPVTADLFTPWLVKYPGASTPVISKNDSVFLFSVKKDGKTLIYCSYRNGVWKNPTDITKQLNADINSFPNSITSDGKILILYFSDGGDGNLYYSIRKDSTWSKARSLGRNINTTYWESHGFITPDGKTLFIASNRPGGKGELDIWKSEKDNKGEWTKPVNCGSTINSAYNENTPFYDDDSNTLLYSSVGHIGMGSYDVFRSVNRNGSWTKPLGIPYEFNTTAENSFFITSKNSQGFITSQYDKKSLTRNIFTLNAEEPADKRIYAYGNVTLSDNLPVNPDETEINLFDNKTGVLIKKIELNEKGSFNFEAKPGDFRIVVSQINKKTDSINRKQILETAVSKKQLTDTGTFFFEIKPGDYQLHISHTGYKTDTININIPLKLAGNYVPVTTALVPEKVASGKFISIKNVLFEYDSYRLSEDALTAIRELKSILINYPELRIEVAGYTDSKGTPEYNLKLADKRAQEIINFLTAEGIAAGRMVKKAFGSSDFAAQNTKSDGSDNPEGRRYNRRATFGIINPKTGIVIRQETYTPIHLRHSNSLKYCIVLLESKKKLTPESFAKMKTEDVLFISSVPTDSLTYYTIGDFYNKAEALTYLNFAKENGFRNAYITDRYKLNSGSENIIPLETVTKPVRKTINESETEKAYTIQVSASRKKLDLNEFKEVPGVKEIYSTDGYFRYFTGEYKTFSEAKSALPGIQKKGFSNAFIRDISSIIK